MKLEAFLLVLSFLSVFALQENGVNVDKIVTYKSGRYTTTCGLFGWDRCARYRRATVANFRCKVGYRSTDSVGCPHGICDGDINPKACNIIYSTSHIINSNGSTQFSSGGRCDDSNPGTCLDCNTGFFNSRERCRMCPEIANCALEECTTITDQTCARCEGVTRELPGYRAYVLSSNRKTCTRACSWHTDSTRCYPGTCVNELATNCRCSTGFSGKHCETISARPNILYNILRLTSGNGETAAAPTDVNRGPSQAISWSNIASPSSVYYKFTAHYGVTVPTAHAFIEAFSVGITGGLAAFFINRGGRMVSAKTLPCDGASRNKPDTDTYNCEGNPSPSSVFSLPFLHRDRIDFSYEAKNGGYVNVRNEETNVLSTHYYNGATQTHQFSLTIDLENPYHCTVNSTCVDTMLKTPNLIKTSIINLSWRDWIDADSGINHFQVEVFELHAVGNELRDKRQVHSKTALSSTTTDSVRLTEVGIYSVILSAYDKAGNHRSTRRVMIYDDTSSVTTRSNTKLQITTASTTDSQWQTTSSPVTVDWKNRYINSLHHNNEWLLGIASIGGLEPLYDDNEGDRTVDPITNVDGIVRITTSYRIDHKGGTSIDSTPGDAAFTSQGHSQSQTISPRLTDGDTLRFWVRAYDVMSSYKEEGVSVHIDTTPPIIDRLWVTRGDRLNTSVHSVEDLSQMTMEWIAYDEHSGIDTVSWRLVDRFDGSNTDNGVHRVPTQGGPYESEQCNKVNASASRGANCYCTPAMGCYHRHFKVKLFVADSTLSHSGIFNDNLKGPEEYYLEVTVTNHAQLTTKQEIRLEITCEGSTYGANCSKRCDDGKCTNKSVSCYNGSCDPGCTPGWRSLDCSNVGPDTTAIMVGSVTAAVVIVLVVVVVVIVVMKKRRLRSKENSTSDHIYYNDEVSVQGSKSKTGKRDIVPQEDYYKLDVMSRDDTDKVTNNAYTTLEPPNNTGNKNERSPNMASDVTEDNTYESVECMTYENLGR